ncbi:uncharacterized protein LOC143885556 [Tasmannia lanceolata]|uniref:uncharacterized protein LOC143885556 n=1 Tax=Tasmannia lanceolata TaxID=3420 RepID=UPI004063B18F
MADTEDLHGQLGEVVGTIILEPGGDSGELDTSVIVGTNGEPVVLDSEADDDDNNGAITEHVEIASSASLVTTVVDEERTLADVVGDMTITTVAEEVLEDGVHVEMVLPITITPDIDEMFGKITTGWHDGPLYHCHFQQMLILIWTTTSPNCHICSDDPFLMRCMEQADFYGLLLSLREWIIYIFYLGGVLPLQG